MCRKHPAKLLSLGSVSDYSIMGKQYIYIFSIMGKGKKKREERDLNKRWHRILEETISIKSFGAGGITVDLPVPPFKSPDS